MGTAGGRVVIGLMAVVIAVGMAACGSGTTSTSRSLIPSFAPGGAPAGAAMYPVPGRVEYRVQETLPLLPSHASAYTLWATTTTGRVAQLADAFGVHGTVSADASGWTATSGDLAVHVQASGGLPWTLGNTSGAGSGVAGCAIASPPSIAGPSGATSPTQTVPTTPPLTCPPTTTVPGLPSQAEAEQIARSDLTKAGFDLSGAAAEVSGSPTSWYVSFTGSVGGVPLTGSPWSVTVGADGTILEASGYLAQAGVAGDYRLAGVEVGLQRLQIGAPWIVFGGPGPEPMIAESSGAAAAVGSGGGAGSGSVGAGGIVAVPPAPPTTCSPDQSCAVPGGPPVLPPVSGPCAEDGSCPTVTQPPPTVVTITGVHLGLGWETPVDAADSQVWLVPVYVFELQGGGTISVLALADDVLAPPGTTVVPSTAGAPGSRPPYAPPPTAQPLPAPAPPAIPTSGS